MSLFFKPAQWPSHEPAGTAKIPSSPQVLSAHEKIAGAILARADLSAVWEIPKPVLAEQIGFLASQFLKQLRLALNEHEQEELVGLLTADIASAAGLASVPYAHA